MIFRETLQLIEYRNYLKCQLFFQKRFLEMKKKFYKLASVKLDKDNQYKIKLDDRTLKTPKGKIFQVRNESLAQAIAQEWNSQQDSIKREEMHLTTLVNTQLDNPYNLNKQQAIEQIINLLESDTLCFRVSEPEELSNYLKEGWNPMIREFEHKFGCSLPVTESMFLDKIPLETKAKISQYLNSFQFDSLFGFRFVVDNLKSLILSLALINKIITVDEAVRLSRLELEFQVKRWGRDWNHNLDLNLQRSRVSAGLLHFIMTNEFHEQTCNLD